jgi:hypothetical protein
MYMKRDKGKISITKESGTLGPLYDVIEIMGDHLARVYEYRGKAREQTWIFKQPCQDRLIVEAIAGFFMTGKFPFRCPMNELMKVSAGRFEF